MIEKKRCPYSKWALKKTFLSDNKTVVLKVHFQFQGRKQAVEIHLVIGEREAKPNPLMLKCGISFKV